MASTRERDGWRLSEQVPQAPAHRVLLLPGFLGSDRIYARLLEDAALADARVHLLAGVPPGFCGTRAPAGFDCSVERYAELVEALCEAEQIDLVVGHGYTANVGIEIAARAEFGGRLMLISPAFERAAESRQLLDLEQAGRRWLLRALAWPLAYRKLEALHASWLRDADLRAALLRDGRQTRSGTARRILLGYFDHLDRHGDLTSRLTGTRTPVYVVRGDGDGVAFTHDHEARLKMSKRIRRFLVLGAGHFATLDEPGEVGKLLVRLLAEDTAA